MDTAHFLAQLLGFSFVIIYLSLLVSPERVKSVWALMEHPGMIFRQGAVRFVIGLAILLAYNSWDRSWRTIITALGWLLVASGVWLMYHPQSAMSFMEKLKKSDWTSLIFVAGVLLGCVLIYFGYTS